MLKLTYLGTCSGTEPWEGRKHVSWVLHTEDGIYIFDAGEGCVRTAHLMGIDIMQLRSIFITHTHMDHVGGLPELIWTVRKLRVSRDIPKAYGGLNVYTPNRASWDGCMAMLKNSEDDFAIDFALNVFDVGTGLIMDDGNITVEALNNNHLPDGMSKSYRIRHDGKTIIFSGDVGHISDMEQWFDSPCDLLLMETGHHKVPDVCNYVLQHPNIKHLTFIHHGRAILRDYDSCLAEARSILGDNVSIANDREQVCLN